MTILLLCVGKTDQKMFVDLMDMYTKRINHYVKFNIENIPENKIKKINAPAQKRVEEAKLIEQRIKNGDHVILLDELGKEFNSNTFAKKMEKNLVMGKQRLVFVVGGAFGFSEDLKNRYKEKLSLSKMTFSHQMIRLFFCEQLYRAFTILNNHPYHNN